MRFKKRLGGDSMATAVRISERLVHEARKYSRIEQRSITGQIEYWAKIGKCRYAFSLHPDMLDSLHLQFNAVFNSYVN